MRKFFACLFVNIFVTLFFSNFAQAASLYELYKSSQESEDLSAKNKAKSKSNKPVSVYNFFKDKFTKPEQDLSELSAQIEPIKNEAEANNSNPVSLYDFFKDNFTESSQKSGKLVESKPKFVDGKTEGGYFALDLLGTKVSMYQRFTNSYDQIAVNQKPTFSSGKNNFAFGLSYKYAFNFNDFFIAPGVFFDFLDAKVQGRDEAVGGYSNYESYVRMIARDRYGIKADFGYDINKTIAPYFTVGYGAVSYNTRIPYVDYDGSLTTYTRSNTARDWLYGAGLKVNYNKDYAFNIEYNTQSFLAKTLIPANDYLITDLYKTTLQTLKIGVSRKF